MVLGVDVTITHPEPVTVEERKAQLTSDADLAYQQWLDELAKLAGDEFDAESLDLFGLPKSYYGLWYRLPPSLVIEQARKLSIRLVWIDYTNHRGERGIRCVLPNDASPVDRNWSQWHKAPEGSRDARVWILRATDMDDPGHKIKDFAMSGIHGWYTRETIGDLRVGIGGEPKAAEEQ